MQLTKTYDAVQSAVARDSNVADTQSAQLADTLGINVLNAVAGLGAQKLLEYQEEIRQEMYRHDPYWASNSLRASLGMETVQEEIKRETDPNGIGQHDAGAKLDQDKNRVGLVLGDFARALWHVGLVGTYGANKYTDHGWLSVSDGINRYTDAWGRHFLKRMIGEEIDPDSNTYHRAQEIWNLLAAFELFLKETKDDKSYK